MDNSADNVKRSLFAVLTCLACGFVLISVYEIDYSAVQQTTNRIARYVADVDLDLDSSNNVNFDDDEDTFDIPNLKLHEDFIKKKKGLRDGKIKMNVTVLSAFRYHDMFSVFITSTLRFNEKIYCRYFDENRTEIGEAYETKVFPDFVVHCVKRRKTHFMSVSFTKDEIPEDPVPLIDRTFKIFPHFFSVCMAPLYGTEPKWLAISEFIEHYRLQGATHFYIYIIDTLNEYDRQILDDYVRTGEVEVIVLHERYERPGARWHPAQLLECMLRSRYHSNWTAFVDLDERLTPTQYNGTLSDYLIGVHNNSTAQIQIRQRWILKTEQLPEKFVSNSQVEEWLPTMRFHNTSHVGPVGHTVKYITQTHKVLAVRIHYVDAFLPGYGTYKTKPEEMVVRHYRDMDSGNWGKKWLKGIEKMGKFELTDYPEKWQKLLNKAVLNRVNHVYAGINRTRLLK